MAKRLADEPAANGVVALSHAKTSQDLFLNCNKQNISIHARIQHNAPKRLHLSPPNDITASAASPCSQEDATSHQSSDKSIVDIKSSDERSLQQLDARLDKLKQDPQDLNIQNKINGPKQTDEVQDACKHLVKTVLDLPVFVTIEGYRVASYLIDGEPHFCLPQLLKFIQRIFPLEKVIDKFEESMTNFVSATPKQVEGFIKAIVLPQDATACPLIKRSDAEWICLALYDQQSKGKSENLINLSSKPEPSIEDKSDGGRERSESPHAKTCNGTDSTKNRADDLIEESSETLVRSSPNNKSTEQSFSSSSGRNLQRSANDPGEQHVTVQEARVEMRSREPTADVASPPPAQETEAIEGQERSSPGNNPKVQDDTKTGGNNSIKGKFFETEAQDSILNLARTVTSTLMIQVYHRCFGKCIGLYYPSLLKNSESDCIECSSCHKMLSPRRFIGHTHGAKEVNVCHWGFNSYYWRSYIGLSRKQSMNNLDDDELLVQFNLLKSVRDEGVDLTKDFQRTSNETEMKSSNYLNEVSSDLDLEKKTALQPHLGVAHSREQMTGDLSSCQLARASTSKAMLRDSLKFALPCSQQLPFQSIGSSGYNFSSLDKIPSGWNIEPFAGMSSRKTSLPARMSLASLSDDPLKSSSVNHLYGSLHSPLASTSSGYQSPPSFMLDPTSTAQANLELLKHNGDANIAHLINGKSNSAFPQFATDRLIKQDLFVSTSLTNYLNAKGIPNKMNQEIVSTTLSLMHRARTSY